MVTASFFSKAINIHLSDVHDDSGRRNFISSGYNKALDLVMSLCVIHIYVCMYGFPKEQQTHSGDGI